MAEIAPPRIRQLSRPLIGTLVGIPSVVYGILGLLVIAPRVARIFSLATGLTGFTAGTVLGLMIVPTIASLAEESILSVSGEYREAALALGATLFEAFWTVVLPAARQGIMASVLLVAGRALGETMTVLIVAG
jgi:phosphate transport system permease protein